MPHADPAKRAASKAAYREQNKDKIKASAARYRAENPDKCRAASKAYRERNPEKTRLASEKWRRENPERVAIRRAKISRKWAYGLSHEEYEAMLVACGNACESCRDPFTQTPHVDHCHTSGRVRGLLCADCNHMIGYGRDNPSRLTNGAAYLSRAEEKDDGSLPEEGLT